jgi:hypothetical protein
VPWQSLIEDEWQKWWPQPGASKPPALPPDASHYRGRIRREQFAGRRRGS